MSLSKKIIFVIAAILVLIVVSVFARNMLVSQDVEVNQAQDSNFLAERITIQEKYSDGTYTVFGVITTPTPCHEVSVDAFMNREAENTYTIALTTRESDEVCAQVITDQLFEYSFEAPAEVLFDGTLNSDPIIFNRVRLPEGEEFINPIEYTKG